MNRFIGASCALAVLLAGCGGGAGFSGLAPGASGGAGSSTGLNPVTTPAPNSHPVVDGAIVTFVVDTSSTDVRASPVPTIAPTSTVFTATIHTGVMFNGHPAFDVQSTSADGNEILDNYEGFEPTPGGQNYVAYGYMKRNMKKQSTLTLTSPDVLILDELPQISGASWTSSDALNVTASSGPVTQHVDETEQRTANSNLHRYTYTDGNSADTVTDTFINNSDGTASQTHQAPSGSYRFSVGLPIQNNGGYVIPTTYTDETGTQSGTVTDWYPGNALPIKPFNSFTAADLGIESPPPLCKKAPQLPATHVRSIETLLEIASFTLDTFTIDSYYVPSRGLVCSVAVDVIKYYDYATGALEDTQTYVTVAALTSGIGIQSDKRHPTSFGASFAPSMFPIQAVGSRHMRAGTSRP